uniref:Uncharacterized protein n=1 Tax=Ditylenchus dipsaci TaxID=166011 RepID=A0A915E629_9BILA
MRFAFVERLFARFFASYIGYVIACPVPFFVLTLVLSGFLSCGLLKHSEAFIKDDLQLYTPTDAKARKELMELENMFYINDSDPYYATRRFTYSYPPDFFSADLDMTSNEQAFCFVIVTSDQEDGDILDPLSLQAAMHLWSVIQSFTIQDFYDSRVSYPSMCVKFPVPAKLNEIVQLFAFNNVTENDVHQFCVSNPLIEAFKFLLLSEVRPSLFPNTTISNNESRSGHTIQQLADAFSSESLGVANLLELKLADFLLSFQSPVIRTAWWTYETLAAESSRDREQLKK